MNKGSLGVGSASIVLVFAVLCLAIFSLISLTAAGNDKALVDAEVQLVSAYYNADTLAEEIIAFIRQESSLPAAYKDTDIYYLDEVDGLTVYFMAPVTLRKELYVEAVLTDAGCSIRQWRLQDTQLWEHDQILNIWQGP